MKKHYSNCPSCRIPVPGTQTGKDEDWHVFSCEPCEEEWGENVRYFLTETEQQPAEAF